MSSLTSLMRKKSFEHCSLNIRIKYWVYFGSFIILRILASGILSRYDFNQQRDIFFQLIFCRNYQYYQSKLNLTGRSINVLKIIQPTLEAKVKIKKFLNKTPAIFSNISFFNTSYSLVVVNKTFHKKLIALDLHSLIFLIKL